MRYMLQRPQTSEWLLRDFELTDGQRTRALSGPGGISGYVEPDWRTRIAADGKPYLWEWGTIIYAVEEGSGYIKNAGIVEKVDYEGGKLTIEAPGFARYPNGIPYTQATNFGRVDPLVVFRHLWTHVQSIATGNIGVTVDPTTTPNTVWIGDNATPYALVWWEHVDCGGEMDNLAKQAPFDYIERHSFTDDAQTNALHHIQIGYPRLGRKRTDLRFAEGENIVSLIPVDIDGGNFANEWIGIGKGEGSAMIHGNLGIADGRLRRPKILTDKTADQARLDSLLTTALGSSLLVQDVSEITVQEHPNAPLSAINPGDDVLIQASLPWLGNFRLWVRVLAIAEADSQPGMAVLSTQRSDSFIYSSTVEVA